MLDSQRKTLTDHVEGSRLNQGHSEIEIEIVNLDQGCSNSSPKILLGETKPNQTQVEISHSSIKLDVRMMLLFLLQLVLLAPRGQQALSVTGVTLKIAVDINGGVADQAAEVSDRFTCPESLDAVHRLRRDSDAILVGRQTVVADNPSLLVRRGIKVARQPLRVILDSRLSLLSKGDGDLSSTASSSYQIFMDGYPTLVYHLPNVQLNKDESLLDKATTTAVSATDENGQISVRYICRDLREEHDVHHLMVEGGPAVARSFLQNKMVDRCVLIRATAVKFRDPIPSNIDENSLLEAGLKHLGTYQSGIDEVECWSKGNWPTQELVDWP